MHFLICLEAQFVLEAIRLQTEFSLRITLLQPVFPPDDHAAVELFRHFSIALGYRAVVPAIPW